MAITERSQIGATRRLAAELSERHGFDATQAGKVGLCITEAATNILKHGGSGQILLRVLEAPAGLDPRSGTETSADPLGNAPNTGNYGIEVMALDKGPGIPNVLSSLRAGVSTAGSPGNGLGALKRLSDSFDIYAPEGKGTAIRMEIWSKGSPQSDLGIGAVCVPKQGEMTCGDAWGFESAAGRHTFLVADGLGHGPDAARASYAAVRVLRTRNDLSPAPLIEACHRALAPTRGAAVAVGEFVSAAGKGSFAGIGNIACRVQSGAERRQLASHNGIVGHNVRRVQQFDFAVPADTLLIFHSDGLATHWNLADYPGLAARHPGVIAGVLYRDHERGRDDVTVLVVRNGRLHEHE
jgi:anti-sigma regulatory factor (Ser/Thr protein kinase)